MTFRFPKSAILLMILSLGGILVVLQEALAIVQLGGPIALMLAIAYIIGAAVCGVRFAMHRAGVHRLAEAETWPRR